MGTCDALSGLCTCPAGWMGFNCVFPFKRYCPQKYRQHGFDAPAQPPNLTAGIGGPSMWMFPRGHCAGAPPPLPCCRCRCLGDGLALAGRCSGARRRRRGFSKPAWGSGAAAWSTAPPPLLPLYLPSGFCEDTSAQCFCPSHTKFGRVPADAGAPPGAPPKRYGRPMGLWCQPNKTEDGQDTAWGSVDPSQLWGPEGWCNAERPQQTCDCYIDGARPLLLGPEGGRVAGRWLQAPCGGHGAARAVLCAADPGTATLCLPLRRRGG